MHCRVMSVLCRPRSPDCPSTDPRKDLEFGRCAFVWGTGIDLPTNMTQQANESAYFWCIETIASFTNDDGLHFSFLKSKIGENFVELLSSSAGTSAKLDQTQDAKTSNCTMDAKWDG